MPSLFPPPSFADQAAPGSSSVNSAASGMTSESEAFSASADWPSITGFVIE